MSPYPSWMQYRQQARAAAWVGKSEQLYRFPAQLQSAGTWVGVLIEVRVGVLIGVLVGIEGLRIRSNESDLSQSVQVQVKTCRLHFGCQI